MTQVKRYKIGEFYDECRSLGLTPPWYIMDMETDAFLKGIEYIDVPLSVFDEMKREKAKHDKWETEYQSISFLRLQGMDDEKSGNIEKAISSYRQCIEMGEQSTFNMFHAYAHAYDRLIILLHKTKQYDLEAQYIKSLLKHDSLSTAIINKYSNRLNKLNLKK